MAYLFDLTANTNSRKIMTLDPNYPKDVTTTVIKGKSTSATFTVEIAEHGMPPEYSYQWYLDDSPVTGAIGRSFTISNLTETVTRKVHCKVTNKKGTVSSRTATLKVTQLYPPTLNSSYPQNATVMIGSSITSKVTISAAGNPASYTYQWYKNGSAVSGATSPSYSFTPTAIGNITLYCKVTNSAGTVTSRTATITVINVHLYNNGDECTSVTGGWKARGLKVVSQYNAAAPTIAKGSNNVTISQSSYACGGVYEIVKDFDLTKFKTLTFNATAGSETGILGLIVYDRSITSTGNDASTPFRNTLAYKQLQPGDNGSFNIDVSGINKAVCIGIAVYNWVTGKTPSVTMTKCVVT